MSCPIFPENNNVMGILLGVLAYYWFSTMSRLELFLMLRFAGLILIGISIYLYCNSHYSFEIINLGVEIEEANDASSEVLSEEMEEVKEMAETPVPESPHEETAEFADLVKPKKVARKYRNDAK